MSCHRTEATPVNARRGWRGKAVDPSRSVDPSQTHPALARLPYTTGERPSTKHEPLRRSDPVLDGDPGLRWGDAPDEPVARTEAGGIRGEARALRVRRNAHRHPQCESRSDQILRRRHRVPAVRSRDRVSLHLGSRCTAAHRIHAFHLLPFRASAARNPVVGLRREAVVSVDRVARVAKTIPIRAANAPSPAFEYFSTKKDEFVGWAR